MKKWIAILGAVIIAIIVVIVIGLSNLGPIIKKAINTYGPKMTQTEVRVGDVDVSLFSVKATLKDFYLGKECIGEHCYDAARGIAQEPTSEVCIIFCEGATALLKKFAVGPTLILTWYRKTVFFSNSAITTER